MSMLGKLGSSLSNLKDSLSSAAGELKEKIATGSTVWVLDGRRYRPKSALGEGGYSSVYLVEDVETGQEYALKRMLLAQEKLPLVQTEIQVMNQLPPHKNLVRLITSSITRRPPGAIEALLLMEYCSGGRMFEITEKRAQTNKPFPEKTVWRIFGEICEAIEVMHRQRPPIAHRDLKVENVLVDGSGVCKLCDFGSATTETFLPKTNRERNIVSDMVAAVATANIQPPEMIDLYRDQLINEKVDIWALGCLLYRLAFLAGPFDTTGTLAIMNVRYTIPEQHSFSQQLVDFIAFLFNPDPSKRPDIYEVLTRLGQVTGESRVPLPSNGPPAAAPRSPLQSHRKTHSTTSFFDSPQQQQKATAAAAQATTTPVFASTSPAPAPAPATPASAQSLFDQLDWFDPNSSSSSASNGRPSTPSPAPQRPTSASPAPARPAPSSSQSSLLDFFDTPSNSSSASTPSSNSAASLSPAPLNPLVASAESQSSAPRRQRSHSRSRSDPSLADLIAEPMAALQVGGSSPAAPAASKAAEGTAQTFPLDPAAKALIVESWNSPNPRDVHAKITDYFLRIVRLPLKRDPAICVQTLTAVHQLVHYGSPQVLALSGNFIRTFEDLHSNWIARQKEVATGVVIAQYSYSLLKKIQFGLAFPMFNGNFTTKPNTYLTSNPTIISALLDVQACLMSVQELLLQLIGANNYLVDSLNILLMDTYALSQALQALLARQAVPNAHFGHLYQVHDQTFRKIYQQSKAFNNLIPGGLVRLNLDPAVPSSPHHQYSQPQLPQHHHQPVRAAHTLSAPSLLSTPAPTAIDVLFGPASSSAPSTPAAPKAGGGTSLDDLLSF